MKLFWKYWLIFFLILALSVSAVACRQAETGTGVLLGEEMAAIDGLPSGQIYRSDASEGEAAYFSPQMMETMYGEGAAERYFSLLEEYAIYLSSRESPYEIAVLRCYARSDTDRIAEMCLARVEHLRIGLAGTPYRAHADAATVRVEGRTVILSLIPVSASP